MCGCVCHQNGLPCSCKCPGWESRWRQSGVVLPRNVSTHTTRNGVCIGKRCRDHAEVTR